MRWVSDTSRADEKDVSRTSAKCAGFFLQFRQRIVGDFGIIFDQEDEGNEDSIVSESVGEKWGWFGVMHRLCNEQIVNLERITNLGLLECLTWLSYETDLNESQKMKLNGKQQNI